MVAMSTTIASRRIEIKACNMFGPPPRPRRVLEECFSRSDGTQPWPNHGGVFLDLGENSIFTQSTCLRVLEKFKFSYKIYYRMRDCHTSPWQFRKTSALCKQWNRINPSTTVNVVQFCTPPLSHNAALPVDGPSVLRDREGEEKLSG